MSKVLHRIHMAPGLEIRSNGDGRTIFGLLVPFGVEVRISNAAEGNFTEVFRRGAFAKTITERARKVRLQVLHDDRTRLPIGSASTLTEATDGLRGEFRVSLTHQGDEVLELIRDGALDGFSIGFRPIRDHTPRPGVIERIEVALHEVSIVATPAYDAARVVGVRSMAPKFIPPDEAQDRLRALANISPSEAVSRLRRFRRT